MAITAEQTKQLAAECGFELAGIAVALPHADFTRFEEWRTRDFAGEMGYLTDHRGDLRNDPRNLLAEAKSIVCVGKLYNTPHPHTSADPDRGWISRYAWGSDYHEVMRQGLTALVERIRQVHGMPFESRMCVDTAPLLERSYARQAGLGWIGKNTCLINQQRGSWFFLGELLLSIPLEPDTPPPDRCGTCRRCIDACPTAAIVANGDSGWTLDSRLCISYLTIELRGPLDREDLPETGNHIFGCDICQDVCPWNQRADVTEDPRFAPATEPLDLAVLASLSAEEFRTLFRHSPVWRAKYEGILRNVAVAMGNSGDPKLVEPLEKLAFHPNATIAVTAKRALRKLRENF
ncbi:MAG TPA: tRNA epoxyqueuosine(34) reductase QueG [Bryobacteraceae bacterium]|nr:tRNA epoxyqueuosine(34) reductase QueG [Bryobacteraceae bacterium]